MSRGETLTETGRRVRHGAVVVVLDRFHSAVRAGVRGGVREHEGKPGDLQYFACPAGEVNTLIRLREGCSAFPKWCRSRSTRPRPADLPPCKTVAPLRELWAAAVPERGTESQEREAVRHGLLMLGQEPRRRENA